ncbi:MAG: GatB/YqeY domain-containing protein [Deltaproteobacteria bacterium]|nr:GatB/YqeY domain-containing protein [Deltaproteobacteria bacterium]
MKDRISQDMKTAMKARDAERLSTLRMMLSELQYKEKEKGLAVDESAAVQVLQSMVRKRRDAAEQFEKGGRQDLVRKELAEITVIESYLPQQLTEDELRALVREAIVESGAGGVQQMGAVMKCCMPKVAGRSDGSTVSAIVKQELLSIQS